MGCNFFCVPNVYYLTQYLNIGTHTACWHVFSKVYVVNSILRMKQFIPIFLSFVLFTSFKPAISIDEVVANLKVGNVSGIAAFFDNTVEITLPEKGNSYSKTQAELVLKDFFNNNPVKGFSIIHKGQNAGYQYCIGTLITKNGNFRTTIQMKQKKDIQVLQEIRFESM